MPRIPPPILGILIAGVMVALDWATPDYSLHPPLLWGLVVICVLVALIFGPPAVFAFRRARTTINPVAVREASSLVTTGPFRLSRNPMYVSLLFLLLALALSLTNLPALTGPALFFLLMNQLQIPAEEQAMRDLFGDSFEYYAARVRRWL